MANECYRYANLLMFKKKKKNAIKKPQKKNKMRIYHKMLNKPL